MPRTSIRVVKLGGSLLEWPELAPQLQQFLTAQPPVANVIVVGGGEFAEAVRRLDEIHHLSPSQAHWLAVETMRVTARLVAALVPESRRIERFDELLAGLESNPSESSNIFVFDAVQFLREVEPALNGERLPEDWTTTSDSIAARLAIALNADELVLLKSTLPTGVRRATTSVELAAVGYVDAALPRIAAGLKRVRCVNLRDDGFAELRVMSC